MKYIYVTDKIIVRINIGGFFMAMTEKELKVDLELESYFRNLIN